MYLMHESSCTRPTAPATLAPSVSRTGPPMQRNRFGDNLRAARTRRGLTQRAVARGLGLSNHAQVSEWERSVHFPTRTNILRLARVIGCPAAELMDAVPWGFDDPEETTTVDPGIHHADTPQTAARPVARAGDRAAAPAPRVNVDQTVRELVETITRLARELKQARADVDESAAAAGALGDDDRAPRAAAAGSRRYPRIRDR